MKTLPSAIATHYEQGTTTLAYLLRVERSDTVVFGFTSADADVVVGGTTYLAGQGLDVSSIEMSSGLNVDNLELTSLNDGSVFVQSEVLTGRWRNAEFALSRYNWASPTDGVDTLMVGTLGEVTLGRTTVTAELRGLQQYLQQPVGSLTSSTCRARLGDALCTVATSVWTVTGTLTSVVSTQTFTDSSRAQAADYFTEGILKFTSGANAGLSQKVKAHAAGGVFTLSLPMLLTVAVGDAYSLVAGCRKRLAEDCNAKFSNAINFQGEPHLPGVDALSG